jgi:hypothetical protein
MPWGPVGGGCCPNVTRQDRQVKQIDRRLVQEGFGAGHRVAQRRHVDRVDQLWQENRDRIDWERLCLREQDVVSDAVVGVALRAQVISEGGEPGRCGTHHVAGQAGVSDSLGDHCLPLLGGATLPLLVADDKIADLL